MGQEKNSNPERKAQKNTQKHGPEDQDEEEKDSLRRFEFGVNLGAYFPNRYSAGFYNGSPGNVNNVNYLFSNIYWYRDIKLALGSIDTVFVDGYPEGMRYNVAFSGGLFFRLNFSRKSSLFLQAGYAQLNTADIVTLRVDPDPYSLKLPDIRQEPIIGKEGRLLIDLGYQQTFPLKSRFNIFVQGGLTMCFTMVLKSVLVVEGTEYNLVNIYGNNGYVPNSNSQSFNINQNKFGFGGYLGVGAGIPLTEMLAVEPGFFTHYYAVNLQGYPDFKPSFGLYLRILLSFAKTAD